MNTSHVPHWLEENPLTPIHVDCSTTVMLKILDGKCKMKEEDKIIMSALYESCKDQAGELFDEDLHELIARAKRQSDEELKNHIYEKRLLAETMISRPVMKAFKAMIRQQGLFNSEFVPSV